MEKIAIISDIHGNITALNTVLEDIKKRNINRIFCLGDMTVKCSEPYECVDRLFKVCEVIVKGNCDQRVSEEPKIEEHYWIRDKLNSCLIEKMKKLPLYYDFYMSGFKIRLMHASPNSVHQKSSFWELDDEFTERINIMFENSEYFNNIGDETPNIAIFGHIHKPMIFRNKDKILLNPGAVSNTSDIIHINGKDYTYGSYLILEGDYGSKELSSISYKIVKFTYDHMKEANNIKNSDMPYKEQAYEELATGKYFSRRLINEKADKDNGKDSNNI